jgi:hypothetical protein
MDDRGTVWNTQFSLHEPSFYPKLSNPAHPFLLFVHKIRNAGSQASSSTFILMAAPLFPVAMFDAFTQN